MRCCATFSSHAAISSIVHLVSWTPPEAGSSCSITSGGPASGNCGSVDAPALNATPPGADVSDGASVACGALDGESSRGPAGATPPVAGVAGAAEAAGGAAAGSGGGGGGGGVV